MITNKLCEIKKSVIITLMNTVFNCKLKPATLPTDAGYTAVLPAWCDILCRDSALAAGV